MQTHWLARHFQNTTPELLAWKCQADYGILASDQNLSGKLALEELYQIALLSSLFACVDEDRDLLSLAT